MTIIISVVACVVCFFLGRWLGNIKLSELVGMLAEGITKRDSIIKIQDEIITLKDVQEEE